MSHPDPLSETTRSNIAFYDAHAADFAERTCGFDMSDLYEPFLDLVPAGGAILDAGCGPGRDAARFLRRGYRVVAIDASAEMVKLCGGVEGVTVRQRSFEEIEDEHAFDGIWASASLLHVSRGNLPGLFVRLARALRPGGVLYASFKQGSGERFSDGRTFTDFEPDSLAEMIRACPSLEVKRIWTTVAKQARQNLPDWVHALAVRNRGVRE